VIPDGLRDPLAHLGLYAEPLVQLAPEGFAVGLARLDLTAGDLPEQRKHGVRSALGDEVPAVPLADGGHDPDGSARLGHGLLPWNDGERRVYHFARCGSCTSACRSGRRSCSGPATSRLRARSATPTRRGWRGF